MSKDAPGSGPGGSDFVSWVWNADTKSDMCNAAQYSGLGLLCVFLIWSLTSHFFAAVGVEARGTGELAAEMAIEVMIIWALIVLAHRLVTWIKPWSGVAYGDMDVLACALGSTLVLLWADEGLHARARVIRSRIWDWARGSSAPPKKRSASSSSPSSAGDGEQRALAMASPSAHPPSGTSPLFDATMDDPIVDEVVPASDMGVAGFRW